MSQVETLLANLNEPSVEGYIFIDDDRFITVPNSLKRLGVQYDHDVETVTFDCPRYWNGNDMSGMKIYVNYMCANGVIGKHLTSNLQTNGLDRMIFDWTISDHVTQAKGKISFLICIVKTDDDGLEIHHWNSELNQECYISEGMDCDNFIIGNYPDIITQLLLRMDEVEVEAAKVPKVFHVTVTDNGDGIGTIDKRYEEIVKAYDSGNPVVVVLEEREDAYTKTVIGTGLASGLGNGSNNVFFAQFIDYNTEMRYVTIRSDGCSCETLPIASESGVLYVSQDLTEEQQTQARENIEASRSPLVVTLVPMEGADGYYTSSHDVQAICAEFDTGRHVVAYLEDRDIRVTLPIVGAVNKDEMQIALFTSTNSVLVDGVLEHAITRALVFGNRDECFAMVDTITPADYIPTKLPNPNALTFTGAATGSYDGSEAKTIDIPVVPTKLPNPNALTFTGAATGSYDGSSAKTVNIPTVPTALKNPNALTFTGAATGSYDGSSAKTVNIPTVPAKLPNPNTLTINGITYDGSSEKTIDISIPDVSGQISTHNASTESHADVRMMIKDLQERLITLMESDATTLDQMTEMVSYIESNKDLIDAITTDKVNVSDIIDNLTTKLANKPLSAAQGVVLKALIDAIKVPTKISELSNDKGYLTSYTETDPTVPAWAKSPNPPAIPTALKNPNALTFTGAVTETYDGSEAKTVNIPTPPTIPTALKNPNALTFTGAATGSYDGSSAKTVNIPTIPTALKNPNALTFTGAATGSYDGSSAKTVNIPTIPTALKNPNALTIDGVSYDGSKAMAVYTGTGKSVLIYGAKGDGTTNDTVAFQNALAANRVVFVPGGTYKLNDELVIGDNCMLELSQDTVLDFTQTSGNCIVFGMSSNLKGNHATVKVPYAFAGHVLHAYSNDHTNAEISAVPPWSRWDPQWKSGRYVSDLNICKLDSRGFHYAVNNNECKGTAVYLSANGIDGYLSFMWGVRYTGLRIAGAFTYGIHAQNFNEGWLHETRIDAFIDACETGVCLEDCSQTYISAIIQPRRGYTDGNVYFPYAKNGIKLIRSKNTDLSGSRVWDWNDTNTLWTQDNEYQHIAMYGDCSGTILNDFTYHSHGDTRERIYSDNTSNLDTLTILQEPITRWFKPVDGVPYFSDGLSDKKLMTQGDIDTYFDTDIVKDFTDYLAIATDIDGTVFNGIGYKPGYRFTSLGTGTDLTASEYYMTTGFIPVEPGSIVYCKDLKFNDTTKTYAGIVYYNSGKARFANMGIANVVKGIADYVVNYAETEDGCSFKIASSSTLTNKDMAYIRLVFPTSGVGTNPMISIDRPIEYTVEGFLADGVKVKSENVIGDTVLTSPSGKKYRLTVADDGTISSTLES